MFSAMEVALPVVTRAAQVIIPIPANLLARLVCLAFILLQADLPAV